MVEREVMDSDFLACWKLCTESGWLLERHFYFPSWAIPLCFHGILCIVCWSQWPRGLRRRFAAAVMLRSWVLIPTGAWKFVCCECCVLSGRRLCYELITRPEESYQLSCVVVCDLATSLMRRPWTVLGSSANRKKKYVYVSFAITVQLIICSLGRKGS